MNASSSPDPSAPGPAEDQFRELVDQLPDAVFEMDANNRLTFANRKAFELFGYSQEDFAAGLDGISMLVPGDRQRARDNLARRLRGEDYGAQEYTGLKEDGSTFPILLHTTPIRKHGTWLGARGVIIDITERKQAEKKLRDSEALYHDLVQTCQDLIWRCDAQGRYTYLNPAWEGVFGYRLDEMLGRSFADFQSPEYAARDAGEFARLMLGGSVKGYETVHRAKDGRDVHLVFNAKSVTDEAGRIIGTRGTAYDITERHYAEDTLKKEAMFRKSVIERAGEGLCVCHAVPEFPYVHFTVWNERMTQITGYTMEEINRRGWYQTVYPDPDYQRKAVARMDQMREGRDLFGEEWEITCADGQKRTLAISTTLLLAEGGAPRVLGLMTDITERKRAEEVLRDERQRLAGILKGTHVGSWEWNVQTGETVFNERWAEIVGYTLDEISPVSIETWIKLCHPDDLKVSNELLERHFRGGLDYYECEARMRHKDGTWVWVLDRGQVVSWTVEGKPLMMMGTHQDITERKRGEESLRLNAERVQVLLKLNQMTDATHQQVTGFALEEGIRLTQSSIGYLAFLNEDETVLTMHSWSRQAMSECAIVEKPIHYLVRDTGLWGEAVRQRRAVITNDYTAPNPLKKGYPTGHVTVRRHMNVPVFVGQRIVLVAGVGNKHDEYDENDVQQLRLLMEGMWRLIERLRSEEDKGKLQAQLLQAQKMESVGRLAGGVAHDFNNMLQAILGHTDLALQDLPPDSPLRESLSEIQICARHSADLTRQLLAFARKQTIAPKVLDLNETIEGLLKMLRRIIGENIELVWLPATNLWPVKIDPSQVDQMLANLCVNARDAIADVGRITLETENCVFDLAYCAEHAGYAPGDYVRLAVSDSGSGMDQETLAHLFEPFFTTKALGKGTGLGLATVYGAVKQNSGFINVYSEPSHGTTFRIYLPRYADRAAQAAAQMPAKPIEHGHETILLVEDEPSILSLTRRLLERMGYTVLTAATPGEAIQVAHEYAGEIHLLMTDVVMPEMNGRDLARNLLIIHPNLKRLFMSGYTANVIAHHGVLDAGVQFIQKPFSPSELAAKLREALDNYHRGEESRAPMRSVGDGTE